MDFEQLLYCSASGVATITLNRPDRLNAWTAQMEKELEVAVKLAAADDQVRVIILTGAGKGFCAGADMSLLATAGQGAADRRKLSAAMPVDGDVAEDFKRKHAWLLTVPKPIIAAVNGPAVGLGFVIPLYCDFRFASHKARFSTIFARRGLVAEYGMAWMLPRIVGLPNAIELCFTSKMLDAAEALRIGLVSRVMPEEGFLEAVQTYAAELAASVSPRSMAVMKRQLYLAQLQGLGATIDLSFVEMVNSFESADFQEGVAHFLEKRAPKFTGK